MKQEHMFKLGDDDFDDSDKDDDFDDDEDVDFDDEAE